MQTYMVLVVVVVVLSLVLYYSEEVLCIYQFFKKWPITVLYCKLSRKVANKCFQ